MSDHRNSDARAGHAHGSRAERTRQLLQHVRTSGAWNCTGADLLQDRLLARGMISPGELDLLTSTDSTEEAVEIIRRAWDEQSFRSQGAPASRPGQRTE